MSWQCGGTRICCWSIGVRCERRFNLVRGSPPSVARIGKPMLNKSHWLCGMSRVRDRWFDQCVFNYYSDWTVSGRSSTVYYSIGRNRWISSVWLYSDIFLFIIVLHFGILSFVLEQSNRVISNGFVQSVCSMFILFLVYRIYFNYIY